MLTRIEVKGFRSLKNFSIEIHPGLNVLVGPNGAGKTNIILFFDFLGNIVSTTLANAVGHAGGIAQVFTKRGKDGFADTIEIAVAGSINAEESIFSYQVSLSLSFSQTHQEVVYNNQEFKIYKFEESNKDPRLYLHAIHSSSAESSPSAESGGFRFLKFPNKKKSDFSWLENEINRRDQRGFFATNCIIGMFFGFDDVLMTIAQDFSGRLILNVVPSRVKVLEDSTREPGIESDGSGLSATLYAIKNKRFYGNGRAHPFLRRSRKAIKSTNWQSILDLVRVAVPSISAIDVENDPFDNLLRCRITIGKGRTAAVLPLGALSDGTVKWISLVARLLTSHEALLLEEPENYLHPLMQREIVSLLRDSVTSSSFMMLSTHSETLLNAVRPNELIVVSYESDGTKARRVRNSREVEAEINSTGFGLGYYYIANVVESDI